MTASHAASIEAIRSSLPPKTDYLTYLTILETHLTTDLLPTLFDILRDHELTANIGWDLIGLLTPLLPASKACLLEVARLGNPREVILKVTESLRQIDFDEEQDDGSDAETGVVDMSSTRDNHSPSNTTSSMPVLKFTTLLSLLSIIHPRIKTKYPSRFLSSTLQAVLASYTDATQNLSPSGVNEITRSIIQFVNVISGRKRPVLPPRKSIQETPPRPPTAPDPEAQNEAPSKDEREIEKRLLQSFITHVLEVYVLSLNSDVDVPGLAWATRFHESGSPEKLVPHKKTLTQMLLEDPQLRVRELVVGRLNATADDLEINWNEIVRVITQVAVDTDKLKGNEEHPTSASDIPLSEPGSLFLLVSRISSAVHNGNSSLDISFKIFSDHELVIRKFLGGGNDDDQANNIITTAGQPPEAIVDAVLALGDWALQCKRLGSIDAKDEEEFHVYLQSLSVISAQNPFPKLRYQAHRLCAAILHAHPSEAVRLGFIGDTLEHCPFENVKESAVGWLKDEMLSVKDPNQEDSDTSAFAPRNILTTSLSTYLFPDLRPTLTPSSSSSSDIITTTTILLQQQQNSNFYITALNLLYLLLSVIRQDGGDELSSNGQNVLLLHEIKDRFVHPLRHMVDSSSAINQLGPSNDEEDMQMMMMMAMGILDETLQRVERELQSTTE